MLKVEKINFILKKNIDKTSLNIGLQPISDQAYNSDSTNSFKSWLKQNNWLYEIGIDILSPVYSYSQRNRLKKFLNDQIGNLDQKIVLNLGSGNSEINEKIINVDIFKYQNVDIACDITDLPFKDNSVDAIMTIAVLEHVPYPKKVVDEIYRVLKPGGFIYSSIPFIQGFHASPYDFQRYTSEGIKILHEEFAQVDTLLIGGPTSGFLWVMQEWIAILFSFGSKKLHFALSFIFMFLTFPIKFLDVFLQFHPCAKNIATAFTYIGKK